MKTALLQLATVRRKSVTIDDVTVGVRELVTSEFERYSELQKSGDKIKAIAYLISLCVVDDNDQPVLTEEEAQQVAKTVRVSTRLITAIMELSGFKEDEEKEPVAS